jgi:hypothetical protein
MEKTETTALSHVEKTELEIHIISVAPSLDHSTSLEENWLPPVVSVLAFHEYKLLT